MSVLKKISHINMFEWYLGCFGVFWGISGYFEAVGFQIRNLAHHVR